MEIWLCRVFLTYGSSSTAPIEIPLPDDKPSDVERLCRILHWKRPDQRSGSDVNVVDALQELKDLTILSDKYACSDSISTVTTASLEFLVESTDDSERVHLLETAYVLDHAAVFEHVSKGMIEDDEGQISELVHSWNPEKTLPIRVWRKYIGFPFHPRQRLALCYNIRSL
jgi:hypothetical protein